MLWRHQAQVEQTVVTLFYDEYYNFFFTPGSQDSLSDFLSRGWVVKHINDTGTKASVLFERVVAQENAEETK